MILRGTDEFGWNRWREGTILGRTGGVTNESGTTGGWTILGRIGTGGRTVLSGTGGWSLVQDNRSPETLKKDTYLPCMFIHRLHI